MGFLIVRAEEVVPFDVPDQTGDGGVARLWIRRIGFSTLRSLRLKHGEGAGEFEKWPEGAYDRFTEEILRLGYTGDAEGFFVSGKTTLTPILPTIADLIAQPEDFRQTLVKAICFASETKLVPPKKGAGKKDADKAEDESPGN